MWLQVSPMEWKPSKEEMKKADMMDPGHEPEGIMEVILLLPYLLYNAALTLFSVSLRCWPYIQCISGVAADPYPCPT